MNMRQLLMASGVMAYCLIGIVRADESRYVQENGVTYYDTYRSVPRTVAETSLQQTTRTVYKEQTATETREVTRTWLCPQTTYRTETEMVGKWNFFMEPYYETRLVPETRWVQHCDVVKMPVTTRKVIPETQTVDVPVTNQKTVYETVRVSRVQVSGLSSTNAAAAGPIARPTPQISPAPTNLPRYQPLQPSEPVGGISRLNSDPPRYSTSPALPSVSR